MLYTAWEHVAAHYASWDYIAGRWIARSLDHHPITPLAPSPHLSAYEVLSEPRDKLANASAVRDFYDGGCQAVQVR